jgi:hypothetical protein
MQIDDLGMSFSDFTWNEIVLEVDRLSRTGKIDIRPLGGGKYALRLPEPQGRAK